MTHTVDDVRQYWNSHLNLTQFIAQANVEPKSNEFYRLLEASLHRYAYKVPLLENFARGRKGQALLEVGCGLGVELAKLGELGFHVTGLDLAPSAVGLCNAYLRRKNVTGKAIVGNAERMSFPDETFDAVYSSGVLQHTPHMERAIDEIWRVLRSNGKLLVVLYHRYSWFNLLHWLSGQNVEFESDDAPIINTFTSSEVKALFSNFRDVNVTAEYHIPTPTVRRGTLPILFNRVFIPFMRVLPTSMSKPFGWHLVLRARK